MQCFPLLCSRTFHCQAVDRNFRPQRCFIGVDQLCFIGLFWDIFLLSDSCNEVYFIVMCYD